MDLGSTITVEFAVWAQPLPAEEGGPGGAGFTPVQVWYMLRANLWLSIAAFALIAAGAFAVIKWIIPKSYEATAALIVNTDVTDPLAGRNQPTYLANISGRQLPGIASPNLCNTRATTK